MTHCNHDENPKKLPKVLPMSTVCFRGISAFCTGLLAMMGRFHRAAKELARLRTRVVSPTALSEGDKQAMWNLFAPFYADVDAARFRADLAQKQFVIVAREAGNGPIRGFTTMQEGTFEHGGRRCVFIFSGDTLLHPDYWGQGVLQKALLRFGLLRRLRHAHRPMFWFLICKGYKTYLLGRRTFADFWPRYDEPTPPGMASVIEQLARLKYPEAWNPETGVFHFAVPAGRLREEVAPLHATLLTNPDIRFFAQANPGHPEGDELACVGLINPRMVLKGVKKLFRRRRPAL